MSMQPFHLLQLLAVVLAAIAMAPALAHALEMPGKLRLGKFDYAAVQPIYYPGFTIAGAIGEFGGLIAVLALLWLTPATSTSFWPTFIGFLALLAAHLAYWIFTHPVNRFWLEDEEIAPASRAFFALDFGRRSRGSADWTVLRDRWEYSHVIRALFATISFISLLTAATS